MSADVIAGVLAEPLCAAVCDLLGEPRVLVPGEMAALLARTLARPEVAAALTPTREDEAARAVLAPLDALLARWQLHGDTDWSKSALIDQFQQALAAARAEANRADRIESTEDGPPKVERGVWRHEDGTTCTSYPDSLNFTYTTKMWGCRHGRLFCHRIESTEARP